jgi:ribosomal-protein-alanine N-acetyltransferase
MFPELSTERFLLTRILPSDQEFIFQGLSHPDVITHYGVRYDTLEATAAQMKWYDSMWEEGTGVSWKIVDKITSERLGVISFYYFKPEHKKAEIGYWLLPAYWKKGVVTEVMKPVIQYCQHNKGIHRLEAFVEAGNVASTRLLEKAGFSYEGSMRDCEIKDGKFISLQIYSILLSTEEFFF